MGTVIVIDGACVLDAVHLATLGPSSYDDDWLSQWERASLSALRSRIIAALLNDHGRPIEAIDFWSLSHLDRRSAVEAKAKYLASPELP